MLMKHGYVAKYCLRLFYCKSSPLNQVGGEIDQLITCASVLNVFSLFFGQMGSTSFTGIEQQRRYM